MRKLLCVAAMLVGVVVGVAGQRAAGQEAPPTPATPAEGDAGPEVGTERVVDGGPVHRNARPEAATLSDEQVMAAVKKGVEYLLRDADNQITHLQKMAAAERTGKVRAVPDNYSQPYGELMLETYALLHVGMQIDDPRLRFNSEQMGPLVRMITRLESNQTYTASLQACALAQLPPKPEYKKALTVVTNRLIKGMGKEGGYTYPLERSAAWVNEFDNSNTQYGLLGVWAASEWGVESPNAYWTVTDAFWRKAQCQDGGWDYSTGKGQSTASMTAAGIASLFIAQEYVNTAPRLEPKADPAMDAGLAHLVDSFDAESTDLYYLYGVERVGLASGLKFFKKTNWYREAAADILSLQRADGSFQGQFLGASASSNTSYALLFLIRGRAPVIMNKLQYGGPWNVRPRDAANLTHFFAHAFEKHLNWQIVSIDTAVEEWLDAPILLITGSKDPGFGPDEIIKLRQFVQAGGILFSVSDGEREAFTEAVKKAAAKVAFNQYEMRLLPKEHPLFAMDAKFKATPKVWGMSNGLRELWVHVPSDYGAAWQARLKSKFEAWDVPTNLYFYATGKGGLRSKLQSLAVAPPARDPDRKLSLARLEYAGNWDPEPGAWARMRKLMAGKYNTDLTVEDVKLAKLSEARGVYEVAHLTGTAKVALAEGEIAELRKYVDDGGTLIIEAAGGNDGFAGSALDIVKQAWPDAAAEVLPPEHELYKAFCAEAGTIREVEYRKFWTLAHGPASVPRLMGVKVKGRLAVFVSAEDFSSGLLGTNTWGIGGYAPASAEALARNLLAWSGRKN